MKNKNYFIETSEGWGNCLIFRNYIINFGLTKFGFSQHSSRLITGKFNFRYKSNGLFFGLGLIQKIEELICSSI